MFVELADTMSRGGTQSSIRKTLGALKDTTTVSLAKINSDYKVLLFRSYYVIKTQILF